MEKSTLISESQFTKMNVPREKNNFPLKTEFIPEDFIPKEEEAHELEDENTVEEEETLLGMEYDIESDEEINDSFNQAEAETKPEDL